MWIAENWKEYKVLDTGNGEKLENWNGYTLIRPDPQILWDCDHRHPGWKHPDGHYHRSSKGGGSWEFFGLPEQWAMDYPLPEGIADGCGAARHGNVLTFNLKPFKFKHTGVFPEQAVNWDLTSRLIAGRRLSSGQPPKILNLFAYTGGATLAAACAGASVTHVDASKGMVGWAKENARSSGLDTAPVRWLVDDCEKFVERELRRGSRYDGIIMDPPSYGRGPSGEVWKIEDSIYPFIRKAVRLLSDTPLFLLINSYTTGLQAGVLTYMLTSALSEAGILKPSDCIESDELGIPVGETPDFCHESHGRTVAVHPEALSEGSRLSYGQKAASGRLILPCGACGRFIAATCRS